MQPSLVVDPTAPHRMAIGWLRLEESPSAGTSAWATSEDDGLSWSAGRNLTTIPSWFADGDSVLATNSDGVFYYLACQQSSLKLFRSYDAGEAWFLSPALLGSCGENVLLVVDDSDSLGHGNLYFSKPGTSQSQFRRSTDNGETFTQGFAPVTTFGGSMTIAPGGAVYLVSGTRPTASGFRARVTWSTNAAEGWPVLFEPPVEVDVGGMHGAWLDDSWGRLWIAADHSSKLSHGNLYLLGSIIAEDEEAPNVRFVRSTDGGLTWSAPVRVNDDPEPTAALHVLAYLSVAPNGRLDALWYDSRNSDFGDSVEVYYSSSTDGGQTWSVNEVVTPPFNWPSGLPLGHYFQAISDDLGANVAYTARFNGERDIYYLRIGPTDCNQNGRIDEDDIVNGTSIDCNGNGLPDECEHDCNGNGMWDECDILLLDNPDCNHDWIPDECQSFTDCNNNGQFDICDIASGTSVDIDDDGVPDECESEYCRLAELLAPSPSPLDHFGSSVAIRDDLVAVGSPDDDDAALDAGSVSVFRLNGATWHLEQKLTASNAAPGAHFGTSVDIGEDMIVVGAPDSDGHGAVYVFERDAVSGAWTEQQALVATDSALAMRFGASVATNAEFVIVGAPSTPSFVGAAASAAYVFRRAGGLWTQHQKLSPADTVLSDRFASSVATGWGWAAVGAPFDDDAGTDAGAAYFYRFNGNAWVHTQKITSAEPGNEDRFGLTVRLQADRAVFGVIRSDEWGLPPDAADALVFHLKGDQWVEQQALSLPGPWEWSGTGAVGMSGNTIGIGMDAAPVVQCPGPSCLLGGVSIYRFDGVQWAFSQAIGYTTGLSFGRSIAIDGDLLVVGAPLLNQFTGTGGAFVYAGGLDCNQNGIADLCDIGVGASGDRDGNGTPDECQCPATKVSYRDPPDGTIDAGQPHPPEASSPLLGIDSMSVHAPGGAPDPVCWSLCESDDGGFGMNSIDAVEDLGDGTFTIRLARPITPHAMTSLRYLGADSAGVFTSHPGNVDGDSIASPVDVLRLIDCLNGVNIASSCPWGAYSCDIDRSGQCGPADILREIDLLVGAGVYEPWNGTARPTDGACP